MEERISIEGRAVTDSGSCDGCDALLGSQSSVPVSVPANAGVDGASVAPEVFRKTYEEVRSQYSNIGAGAPPLDVALVWQRADEQVRHETRMVEQHPGAPDLIMKLRASIGKLIMNIRVNGSILMM
ncbi:hypothetical protein FJZ28_02985 [Candidatus Peregrinibacteria bacterium]|nr:hypothetical protein [Candidatus Peregrinibacteria bacterium]